MVYHVSKKSLKYAIFGPFASFLVVRFLVRIRKCTMRDDGGPGARWDLRAGMIQTQPAALPV
jgi:hypothetical protein